MIWHYIYPLFVWLCKQLFQQAFLGKQSTRIKFDIFRKNVRLRIIIHLHKGKGPHKTLLKLAESNSINMTIYTLSIECCFFDISHQLMRKAALSAAQISSDVVVGYIGWDHQNHLYKSGLNQPKAQS